MLNELYSLATTLKEKGIEVEEWHDSYDNALPRVTLNAPCIRIWLAKDGSICGMESISEELAQSLRKYGDNQKSFPAFNINSLYRITDKKQISELERIEEDYSSFNLEKLKSWCVYDNWKKSRLEQLNRNLHCVSKGLLDAIGIQQQIEYDLVFELVRLADGFSGESNKSFRTALESCIFTKLQKQEDISLMLSVLFYKGDSEKAAKEDTGKNISIILDVFDWQRYKYPVASTHVTKWINEKLLSADTSTSDNLPAEKTGYDAFGMSFVNPNTPMPVVKLSSFRSSLRTMFDEHACQLRYAKINDGSYPISPGNRSSVKKALIWLSKIEHEGVMWQKIDEKEFVFVYPSKLPEILPKFVSVFGANQIENSACVEARFENIAKEFIKSIQGITAKKKLEFIQIFTIRKTDKNPLSTRAKIVFTRKCLPEQLITAAEKWERGCNNIPENDLEENTSLFPLQAARIVNNVWKKNGELAPGKSSVERMKCYQGIELLLDIMQNSMICNYLHIVLVNSSGLVNYFGNWVHGGAMCKDKKDREKLKKIKKEIVLLLSVLGLLLDKNNERKEKYMENVAYLVGQLLKISDELHTLYCKVVRNGDVPPQLAGSALFVTAGETPYRAMAQLSRRMNPYITWAKQYRFKNIQDAGGKSLTAAWYLKLYEDAANKLKETMTDSTRFNDFEKAQLFIGYLASFPKNELTTNTNEKNNDVNMGGSYNE